MSKKILIGMFFSCMIISSCNPPNFKPENNAVNVSVTKKLEVADLTGKIKFPESFKIKAIQSDISTKATVSLIYPSDYPDTNLRNSSVASGISDSKGNFRLSFNSSFTPQSNDVFVLEAVRRKGGAGTGLLSLRTQIKWTDTGWESITGKNVYISVETSVIAAISNLNPADLSSLNSLNKLTVDSNENFTFQPINQNITLDLLNYLKASFDYEILNDEDPIKNIRYENQTYLYNKYYINDTIAPKIALVKANMHTLQTTMETYAVDYAGCYPTNLEELIAEATKPDKNYYTPPKNPFNINSGLPGIMSYNEYITAKQTLTYKNITLKNKTDLMGIIVFEGSPIVAPNPCSLTYKIYGVDIDGEFIKEKANNTFILSNN